MCSRRRRCRPGFLMSLSSSTRRGSQRRGSKPAAALHYCRGLQDPALAAIFLPALAIGVFSLGLGQAGAECRNHSHRPHSCQPRSGTTLSGIDCSPTIESRCSLHAVSAFAILAIV